MRTHRDARIPVKTLAPLLIAVGKRRMKYLQMQLINSLIASPLLERKALFWRYIFHIYELASHVSIMIKIGMGQDVVIKLQFASII